MEKLVEPPMPVPSTVGILEDPAHLVAQGNDPVVPDELPGLVPPLALEALRSLGSLDHVPGAISPDLLWPSLPLSDLDPLRIG